MNLRWLDEAMAEFQKEWRTEMRQKSGILTSFLFSFIAVVAMSVASFGEKPTPGLAGGMFAIVLLFAAVISLPRTFIVEDEQNTIDLLRLVASPSSVFLGKLLFSLLQIVLTSLILALIFTQLVGLTVFDTILFGSCLLVEGAALASTISLCGLLVIGASNRWLLVVTLALPLLMPQMFLVVSALKTALTEQGGADGWQAIGGLAGFSLVSLAIGPTIAEAVWRRS